MTHVGMPYPCSCLIPGMYVYYHPDCSPQRAGQITHSIAYCSVLAHKFTCPHVFTPVLVNSAQPGTFSVFIVETEK